MSNHNESHDCTVKEDAIDKKDLHLLTDLNSALQQEKNTGLFGVVIFLFLLSVVFIFMPGCWMK